MRRLALPFVLFPGLPLLALAGCHQGYSPNTYAANAAQQEAAVQRGVIIGVRQVLISANGSIGAATGAAAGGVTGAQVPGTPVVTALGAIGGTLVGGIAGSAAAQAAADTKGWEYIVEEDGDKLVSVTQTSKIALPIGQHVLVISDAQQARIVPDYTVQIAAAPPATPAPATPAKTPPASAPVEIYLGPLAPETAAPQPAAPVALASDPPPAPTSAPPAAASSKAANNTIPATPGAPLATPPKNPAAAVTP